MWAQMFLGKDFRLISDRSVVTLCILLNVISLCVPGVLQLFLFRKATRFHLVSEDTLQHTR